MYQHSMLILEWNTTNGKSAQRWNECRPLNCYSRLDAIVHCKVCVRVTQVGLSTPRECQKAWTRLGRLRDARVKASWNHHISSQHPMVSVCTPKRLVVLTTRAHKDCRGWRERVNRSQWGLDGKSFEAQPSWPGGFVTGLGLRPRSGADKSGKCDIRKVALVMGLSSRGREVGSGHAY